jgi:hypothetical protein
MDAIIAECRRRRRIHSAFPEGVHHLTDAIKIRSATPAKIRAIGTTRINTAMIVKIRTKREFSVDLI